jgi:hypothetical protein
MAANASSSGPARMAKFPGSPIAGRMEPFKFDVHLLTPFSLLRI